MYFSDSLSLLTGLKETKTSKFSCLRKQHNEKDPWMDKAVTETDCNNIVFFENLLDSQFFSKFIFFFACNI